MKKFLIIIFVYMILFIPVEVNAKRGCCSHHGGVSGCSSTGRQICRDGTLSPTCPCTPTITSVYGCNNQNASNYNHNTNKDDGMCKYSINNTNTQKINDDEANEDSDFIDFLLGLDTVSGGGYLYKKIKKK